MCDILFTLIYENNITIFTINTVNKFKKLALTYLFFCGGHFFIL